jgi:ParB/RepB/Spo0J family partition protein
MSKSRKEAVGGLLAGIDLDGLTDPGRPRHPMGEDFGYEVSDELYLMDPRRIELEGPYVRNWVDEDADFHAFCDAVAATGEIEQPIGIRTVGGLLEKRYVLIYGMRRWKASLKAGLSKIPVRDYGEISEERSLSLQMIENETRADPHPVDTAYGYHLLVENGETQAEVARRYGRTPAYVSYMRAVGEAIASLAPTERDALYRSERVTVRAFQEIATRPKGARPAALLELLRPAEEDTPVSNAVQRRTRREGEPFQSRELRGGRSFRVRWRDADLREEPEAFTEELHDHVTAEYERLATRLRAIERKTRVAKRGAASAGDPEAIARAAARIEAALAEMRRLAG